MRTEAKVFGIIAGLLLLAAVVYLVWTGSGPGGHPEWAGGTVLGLSGLMSVLLGGYCTLVARRMPLRPEDRPGAAIADGAGSVGFFAPSGFWQVGIAVSVAVGAAGIAVSQWWLAGAGAIAALLTVTGLALEFYAGAPESR